MNTYPRAMLLQARCAECNQLIFGVEEDEEGVIHLQPCDHDAGIIAELVNRGDPIRE